ncbi:MAG: DUF4920 domain-containing protein [Planctomycetota bacterium]|jgi:hypothetical protein
MARRRFFVGAAIVLLVAAGTAGWLSRSGRHPIELGRSFDPGQAIGLAEALASGGHAPSERLVIRGRVGEVCRSAGCWFVLQEIKDGRLHEVFVDLKKNGGFTVRRDATGRRVLVSGSLVGAGPDVTFEADGLRLE